MTTASTRVRVRRQPQRGVYDRAAIDAILDEGLICHLGFSADDQPYVIPTAYARDGGLLYIHGSAASRTLRVLAAGSPVCVTVTLVDGLVLARSAFHHSVNYRSVVVLGTAREVTGRDEKLSAVRVVTDHLVPGRWQDVRPPTDPELKATRVLAINLDEASAKVRVGPPVDDDVDYARPTWAGVIPLRMTADRPLPDPALRPGIPTPRYLTDYQRKIASSATGPSPRAC